MTIDRCAISPRGCLVAVSLALLAPAASAEPPTAPRRTVVTETINPVVTAQTQIARLRQTASQLQLLAGPAADAPESAPTELTLHRQWLHDAGRRLTTLADHWQQRLEQLHLDQPRDRAQAHDLNSFFTAQVLGLQTRLERESTSPVGSAPVRAARDAAKVVIGNLN